MSKDYQTVDLVQGNMQKTSANVEVTIPIVGFLVR